MKELTDKDLTDLISEHLDNCEGYQEVCKLKETDAGKQRLITRVKEMITQDGLTSIEACLAQIESELIMDI